MKHDKVTPYESEASKKEQVAEMFNSISGKYDFLNHFFSLGIDKQWRKKAIKELEGRNLDKILDVATGTGDFAFEAMKLKPNKLVGIDISAGMLDIGRQKISKRKLDDKMEFLLGDSESLPFEDETFDAVTVSFGVRNFQNLVKGLTEIFRVLKPGGKVVILEFSKPKAFPLKQGYYTYFKYIMPKVGHLISKDKSAYSYLPKSVLAFPEGKEFEDILKKIGFGHITTQPVTAGIASIYTGEK
jgi:demethylmenaquinone methyltransferase/2-methoxy-6-polyprenyl-1,4-benzoquinol methylase